jgi:hypothetical protein
MNVSDMEHYALIRLYSGDDALSKAVAKGMSSAKVVRREDNVVGFFVTIEFPEPLPDESGCAIRDWSFVHPRLTAGGSFMAWREGERLIVLEGVSFVGELPLDLNPEGMSDM